MTFPTPTWSANGVTVDVTGAQDANGNAQQDYTALAEFDIDTANPTVTSVMRTTC